MLKSARHSRIRELVESRGEVTVGELNDLLAVSDATIRRDLEELAQRGWVRRTHGGAVSVGRAEKEPPILQRAGQQLEEKRRIGRAAAAMVRPGDTIFLGSGSTVQAIAENLHSTPNLTVITNALNVVNELAASDNVELIVIGGMFRKDEMSMVSHIAEQAIREFRADWVFMGMRGIDPVHGFTNDYLPEARTDRTILKMAPQIVIVADHSKLGVVSTVYLAPVTAAHVIVTDSNAPRPIVEELEALGLGMHLV
jgi:DeoR family transcriptional regulator, aga operon transcriptional repressor